jgi:uncharacterized protein (TIGR03032 family)
MAQSQPDPNASAAPNRRYTSEAANVATGADVTAAGFDPKLLAFEETGGFFELLAAADHSLFVTREYEHFLLALDGGPDGPVQSPFPLPHPSGFWFDTATRELVVSSTRTPNILIWMSPYTDTEAGAEIRPDDVEAPAGATLFLPRRARYLPGSLYIHDVVMMGRDVYATITGHNFLAKLSMDGGFERVWWPKGLDGLGRQAFNQNYFQLNSIAVGGTPEASFYTGFSDQASGTKPWKAGYGPRGKGVVFSGRTREPLLRGLTCPHAAKLHDGKLWLCDSGFGSIGRVENFDTHDPERTRYVEVAKAPGFTRGLAFAGDHVYVGLSKVIKQYEPYAPGLNPDETRCGVWVFNWRTGETVATLSWPEGYQIYDVQVLPGVKNPRLPLASRASDGINPYLRFLA